MCFIFNLTEGTEAQKTHLPKVIEFSILRGTGRRGDGQYASVVSMVS